MAAVKKITESSIIKAALSIIRERGMGALNARSLAAALGCSTRPVYLTFKNMDGVKQRAAEQMKSVYDGYLSREVADGKYPPFKAMGMGYIKFAREEREYFRYLFMRDRSGEVIAEEDIGEILAAVMAGTGLDEERARLFHLESWVFVHGIAVMLATSYIDFDEGFISQMLTDMFTGLKIKYRGEESDGGKV